MGDLVCLSDWLEHIDGLLSDPVDRFEDELSCRLGLARPLGISEDDWRRERVAFIRAHPDADSVAGELMQLESGPETK